MKKKLKLKNTSELIPYWPSDELLDKNFIVQGALCIKNNDLEGASEILQAHVRVLKKYKKLKKD